MNRYRWILCLLGAWLALAGVVRAQITYRVVARSGSSAPGIAAGEFAGNFASFHDLPGDAGPVINNAGQVAFTGRLRLAAQPVDPVLAAAQQNDRGIWSEGNGSLRLVAREGMPAPGTASYFGNQLREPVLNDKGQVAFQANLLGSDTDASIWIGGGNLLVPIARTGDDPPPLTDDNDQFLSFDDPLLNNSGHTAFRALIHGPGIDPVAGVNDRGIWSKTAAGLALVPRAGEVAPGTPIIAGANTLFTDFSSPVLNDAGEIAFRAVLVGNDVTANNMHGIWAERAGVGLRLVAREGAHAPGTDQSFAVLGLPAFNVRGRTAFAARLLGGGNGIWKEEIGGLQLVARNGDSVGNNSNGLVFAGFDQPLLTNLNRVAFAATLAGPDVTTGLNDRGIFIERRAGLAMVARTGDEAPGTSEGVVFANCDQTRGNHFSPVVNERGQVAFLSCLAGPGINDTNDLGLFAVTPERDLVKVAQTGDFFDVASGIRQPITDIRLKIGSGGADGRGRAFNVRGDLAFWLAFGNGAATLPDEAVVVASTWESFPLLGDANGDGWVDGQDIALLIDWYASDDFWEGDFDYDGSITVKDLAILQNNYGGFGPRNSPGDSPVDVPKFGTETVPEPAAWLLAATGLACVVMVSRRGVRQANS
jgi:hypothetical protein